MSEKICGAQWHLSGATAVCIRPAEHPTPVHQAQVKNEAGLTATVIWNQKFK